MRERHREKQRDTERQRDRETGMQTDLPVVALGKTRAAGLMALEEMFGLDVQSHGPSMLEAVPWA